MELYHLHLKGNHDRLYKEKSEFIIDKDKFNNRIYNRIYDMNATVDVTRYKQLVNNFNYLLQQIGMPPFEDRINLGEIIGFLLLTQESHNFEDKENLLKLLADAREIIAIEGINIREMAMEEYRKENCINLPSRLHSLYACTEEGVNFWSKVIRDNDVDIYRIDVFEEPFVSNEILLPNEGLCYGDKVKASCKYFHPKKKNLNPETNEYLVQGKVKIKEKVLEIKNK